MGLDQGFHLKKRDDPKFFIDLITFRKYFELSHFFQSNAEVNEDDILELHYTIKPIYLYLIRNFTKEELEYYQEKGFMDDMCAKMGVSPFSPALSSSAFPVDKLIKLYHFLCTLLEIFKDLDTDTFYIEYWESF